MRSPAAIVLVLFIMVGGYFWGRQFNVRDIQQRDAAIQQLQSDGQRLAADIADQNANLTSLRAELTSTKAALNAIMPSHNTYNINPNQSLIAADGRLTIGLIGSPGNDGINLNVNGKQQKVAAGDVIRVSPPKDQRRARCRSSPSICSRPCWSRRALRRNRSRVPVGRRDVCNPTIWLFPNQHVRQRAVDAPEQGVTDAGEAAEHAQIESPFAAVPAIIAGRGGAAQNRRQPLRRKRAKIVAAKRVAGRAEEFDAAKRAAAQRIDGGGPAELYAFDGVLNVDRKAARHPSRGCLDVAIRARPMPGAP